MTSQSRSDITYLLPTDNIIVINSYYNLAKTCFAISVTESSAESDRKPCDYSICQTVDVTWPQRKRTAKEQLEEEDHQIKSN